MSKEKDSNSYDNACNDYKRWIWKAEELMTASSFLEKAHEEAQLEMKKQKEGAVPDGYYCYFSDYLLKASAIENYLKAMFIKNGKTLCLSGKYIGEKRHDLNRWATLANLITNDEEKNFLNRLSLVLNAFGKYPIPMREIDYRRKIEGCEGLQPIFVFFETDKVILKNIIGKINNFLQ